MVLWNIEYKNKKEFWSTFFFFMLGSIKRAEDIRYSLCCLIPPVTSAGDPEEGRATQMYNQ